MLKVARTVLTSLTRRMARGSSDEDIRGDDFINWYRKQQDERGNPK